jgi:antitoxin component YwqK of YwqJK toxin-antitoxin module
MIRNQFYITLLVLFCVSKVWGQKEKLPLKDRFYENSYNKKVRLPNSLCHYEWLNDKKVFVNLHKLDTIKLNQTRKLKNIKRIEYKSYNNDSLPHYLLGEIDLYVAACILPDPIDVPLKIKEFQFSFEEFCEKIQKINLVDFLNLTPAIRNAESILLTGKRNMLFSLPEAIKNNKNLINLEIYHLTFIPLELIFNPKINFISRGLSPPENYLLNNLYKNNKNKATILLENGVFTFNYANGNPVISGQFKNGKLIGEWLLFNEDSSVAQKRYYHDGKETGEWVLFFSTNRSSYIKINYEQGNIVNHILKTNTHKKKTDTTINWRVNEKACELNKDIYYYYMDSKIETIIQLIDCEGNTIEERFEEKSYNLSVLEKTVQKFYLDGLLVKQVERVYDYNRNIYIETISKDQIITSKEFDITPYFNLRSIDFDLHNTK